MDIIYSLIELIWNIPIAGKVIAVLLGLYSIFVLWAYRQDNKVKQSCSNKDLVQRKKSRIVRVVIHALIIIAVIIYMIFFFPGFGKSDMVKLI